jgi:hypothetical protein
MDYYDSYGTIISSSSGSNRIPYDTRETDRDQSKIPLHPQRNIRTVKGWAIDRQALKRRTQRLIMVTFFADTYLV